MSYNRGIFTQVPWSTSNYVVKYYTYLSLRMFWPLSELNIRHAEVCGTGAVVLSSVLPELNVFYSFISGGQNLASWIITIVSLFSINFCSYMHYFNVLNSFGSLIYNFYNFLTLQKVISFHPSVTLAASYIFWLQWTHYYLVLNIQSSSLWPLLWPLSYLEIYTHTHTLLYIFKLR